MNSNDFFELIQHHYSKNLPFVAYHKPNDGIIKAMLQSDLVLHHVSGYSERGFVFAPFDDQQQTILIPLVHSESIETDYKISNQERASNDSSEIHFAEKQTHIVLVQKGIDAIKNGKFKKVVLSRSEHVELNEAEPLKIFKTLLNTYETAFVYCFFHPKAGMWLGATPETLLKMNGTQLTTMALAGTQKYNGTLEVTWGQKERDEQHVVTDFIAKNLESSLDNIHISKTETVKAGNLLHLKTDIKVNYKPENLNLKQIIQKLHPTPAVCGFPKQGAKQFILENEKHHREFYTGFLGELNLQERKTRNSNRHNVENDAYSFVKTVSNLYVNLRCMKLNENRATIYVGGGVTKDSVAENEWEETVAKSQIIKSVL